MWWSPHPAAQQVSVTTPVPAQAFQYAAPVLPTPVALIVARWLARALVLVVRLPFCFPVAFALVGLSILGVHVFGTVTVAVVVGVCAALAAGARGGRAGPGLRRTPVPAPDSAGDVHGLG